MSEVADVIVARQQRAEPFGSMLIWSIAVHAGLLAFFIFGPAWHLAEVEPPKTFMNISLAGAPGPDARSPRPSPTLLRERCRHRRQSQRSGLSPPSRQPSQRNARQRETPGSRRSRLLPRSRRPE